MNGGYVWFWSVLPTDRTDWSMLFNEHLFDVAIHLFILKNYALHDPKLSEISIISSTRNACELNAYNPAAVTGTH